MRHGLVRSAWLVQRRSYRRRQLLHSGIVGVDVDVNCLITTNVVEVAPLSVRAEGVLKSHLNDDRARRVG